MGRLMQRDSRTEDVFDYEEDLAGLPTFYVPERGTGSNRCWPEADLPHWSGITLRADMNGLAVLHHDDSVSFVGLVSRLGDGLLRPQWMQARPLPYSLRWVEDDGLPLDFIHITRRNGSYWMRARAWTSAALMDALVDPDVPAEATLQSFKQLVAEAWEDAEVAGEKEAVVRVVKHPTRRGRAVTGVKYDPLTPWALAEASAALLRQITTDPADVGLYAKRIAHLGERAKELQAQLDEVAGQLAVAQQLLRASHLT